MATKAHAAETKDAQAETNEAPLLDLNDSAVKKLLKTAKRRGYVTHDELNAVMPSEEVTSEQIEDMMAMLNDMGINVVEQEEAEEAEEAEGPTELAEAGTRAVQKTTTREPTERTDDPVRMYLREMGSVELLSREGEIAIAKRIEAGRNFMIAGLCESPLTFQAIIIWRDELIEGRILLRDIIDLEATYADPDGKGQDGETAKAAGVAPGNGAAENVISIAGARTNGNGSVEEAAVAEKPAAPDDETDEDDYEASMSLAAMEAELKPKVLETFESIADNYKKLRKLQEQVVANRLADQGSLSPAQQKRYKKLHNEIVTSVKSLLLNPQRIETLVEQLYDINKRLIGVEGRLMRLADSYGVNRSDFIKHYQGYELAPDWTDKVGTLPGRGWSQFVEHERGTIDELRGKSGKSPPRLASRS